MSRAFRSAQQQSSSIQSSIHRLPTCTEMGETAIEMCLVGNTPSFYSPAKRTTTESFYPTFSLSLFILLLYPPTVALDPFSVQSQSRNNRLKSMGSELWVLESFRHGCHFPALPSDILVERKERGRERACRRRGPTAGTRAQA